MIKILSTYIVVMFFLAFSAYSYAKDVVTVRVAEFPPNYFKDDSGKWTGLSVELAEAIISAAGLEPQFVELPWTRAMLELKSGGLLYMTNLSKTEERSEFLFWIGPVRVDRMGLFVHRENQSLSISSLDDILVTSADQNKQFGLQENVNYSRQVAQRLGSDPKFKNCFYTVDNVDSILKMTANQRILGFFESIYSIQHRIKNDPKYVDLVGHSFVLEDDSSEMFHGLSMKGVSPALQKKIQQGYERCVKDGSIQRILEKWNAQ